VIFQWLLLHNSMVIAGFQMHSYCYAFRTLFIIRNWHLCER